MRGVVHREHIKLDDADLNGNSIVVVDLNNAQTRIVLSIYFFRFLLLILFLFRLMSLYSMTIRRKYTECLWRVRRREQTEETGRRVRCAELTVLLIMSSNSP